MRTSTRLGAWMKRTAIRVGSSLRRSMHTVPARSVRALPRPLRSGLELSVGATLRWVDAGGAQLGAAIAFYTMFAMSPLLLIAIGVAGAVLGPEAARGQIVGQIQGLIGPSAARGVEALIRSTWRSPDSTWASVFGVATLLVGASGVFVQLRSALNIIGRTTPLPSALGRYVRVRLVGIALVLGFGFLSIASLLLSTVMAAIGAHMAGLWPAAAPLLSLAEVLLSAAVLTVAFAALLRWLPDTPPSWKAVVTGATGSALLFSVGKHLIGLYLGRAGISSSYGAAGSFVVVMLWAYYSAQILLFGGALAATWDGRDRHGAMRPGGNSGPTPSSPLPLTGTSRSRPVAYLAWVAPPGRRSHRPAGGVTDMPRQTPCPTKGS